MAIIISSQCSRIDGLKHDLDRQENNIIAMKDTLRNYEDELGRANAERHAYQLTQKELRDSIGLLKQKNYEYVSYINTQLNIKDTVTIETVIIKELDAVLDDGTINFGKSDVFGKSSRTFSASIPYSVIDNTLYTGDATFSLDQDIFVEGWLERNTKTNETFVHLRSDYPGLTFNSGLGVVAEAGNGYERSMRKSWGLGLAVGPNFSMSYDFINQRFVPTVGVGVTLGLTYTPKFLQW